MLMPSKTVSGTVHIGAGETKVMRLLAQAMNSVRQKYPAVVFEIHSGNSAQLKDNLVKGYYDIMLECELQHHAKMNMLQLPETDRWGIVAREDSELIKYDAIRPQNLIGVPLITSQQGTRSGVVRKWAGELAEEYDVVATYNLPLNCKFLIHENVGVALVYEELIDTGPGTGLRFIPLAPKVASVQGLVWRKTLPTKQTQVFLDHVKTLCESQGY